MSPARGCPALLLVLLVATLNACGSGHATSSSAPPSAAAARRIDRCVDRLLAGKKQAAAEKQAVRAYARKAYCGRFEQSGWIYADGALSIAAQKWLDSGASCATASEGKPARTVPCGELRGGGLDCALLHAVRRTEVRDYIDRLQRRVGTVRCDDGTALDTLGAP